jgi:hypothetical protein
MLIALVSNQLMATEDRRISNLDLQVSGKGGPVFARLKFNQILIGQSEYPILFSDFKLGLANLEAHLKYSPTSQKGVMEPPVCDLLAFNTDAKAFTDNAQVLFEGVDCDAVLSIQNACKFPKTVFYFRGGINLKTDREGVVSFTSLSAPDGKFTLLVAASGFVDRGIRWPAGSYILHDRGISPASQENVMMFPSMVQGHDGAMYMGLHLENILSAAIDWQDGFDSDCEKWLIRVFGDKIRRGNATVLKEDAFKAFVDLVNAALPSGESSKLKNEFIGTWRGRIDEVYATMIPVIPAIRDMVQDLGTLYKEIGRMNPKHRDLAGDCRYMQDKGGYAMTPKDTAYKLRIDLTNPDYQLPTLVRYPCINAKALAEAQCKYMDDIILKLQADMRTGNYTYRDQEYGINGCIKEFIKVCENIKAAMLARVPDTSAVLALT